MPGPAVAIIHEWLTNVAGSEKVVAELRRVFPDASVWTSMCWGAPFEDWASLNTSFLQRFASGPSSHIRALPLMPLAFRSLRLPDHLDLAVTSFHSFAMYTRIPAGTRHLVYCHTPPRFLWAIDQLSGERGARLQTFGRPLMQLLRKADRRLSESPDMIVANSANVSARIERAYERHAPVVHPPVDVDRFRPLGTVATGDYFLVVSRLVPYKHVALAVAAFNELKWPLTVIGSGRQEAALKAAASDSIRFLGHVSDDELPRLMAGARALIMPGEEDFGITAVEAMACGVPVVALGRGGATETVVPGLSGTLFDRSSVQHLIRSVRITAATDWDRAAIAASVERFHERRFRAEIRELADGLTSRSP